LVPTVKYMQTLHQNIFTELNRIAEQKGISIQELIRAVIVPDWIRTEERRTRPSGTRGFANLYHK